MTYLTRYGLRVGYALLGIIGLSIVLITFYYFDLIGDKTFNFLELVVVLINIFINSFILGKASNKKGYIEGAKFGGIIVLLELILTLLFFKFKAKILIYFVMVMVTAILGSMVGISKKRN